jgi:hypothetical protein
VDGDALSTGRSERSREDIQHGTVPGMTVFRVPDGAYPVGFPVPPAASVPPAQPPSPPPTPGAALVAGVLGMVSAVLSLLVGSFWVLTWWSVEGTAFPAVWLATMVVLVCGGHFTGAILVLCGRSGGLLALTSLSLAGVAVLHVLVIPAGASVLPLVMGLAAVAVGTLALTSAARGGRTVRRPGALALPEEPWWP